MNSPDMRWLERSPLLVAMLDRNLVCRALSRRWRRRLLLDGIHDDDVPLSSLFADADNADLADVLRKVLLTGEPVEGEAVRFPARDGHRTGHLAAWPYAVGD